MARYNFKHKGVEHFNVEKGVPYLMDQGLTSEEANSFVRNAQKSRGGAFGHHVKTVTLDQLDNEAKRIATIRRITQGSGGDGGDGGGGGDETPAPSSNGLVRNMQKATSAGTRELDRISGVQEEIAGTPKSLAEVQLDRYLKIAAPLEDEFFQSARVGRDPRLEAQGAAAGVSQQFSRQREMGTRNLQAAGIQPGSPRYERFLRELGVAESLGRAGAQRSARNAARTTNDQRKVQAINIGRGFPADTINAAGTAGNIQAGAADTRATSVGLSQVPFQTAADIYRAELGASSNMDLQKLRGQQGIDQTMLETALGLHDEAVVDEGGIGFKFGDFEVGYSTASTDYSQPSSNLPGSQ